MKTIEAKVLDAKHLELSEPVSISPGKRVRVSIEKPHSLHFGNQESEKAGPATDQEASHTIGSKAPQGHRHRELAWCRSHQDVLLQFAGQWLVLEGEEIVAHGEEPARLVEQARAKGIPVPYIFFVDPPRPDTVKMGL